MNGRIYDPTLGRFLQADPHIQAPQNSQSYNRYSYVLNNPLSYTDPSGYFFSKLWKGIKKFAGVIAGVLVAMYCQWCALNIWNAAFTGAAIGAGSAALNGGNILKGALIGAFSGAAFQQIGEAFNASSGFFAEGGLGHIAAHGLTGGITSVMQGGKFGHGFFSAGLTKALNINKIIGTAAKDAGIRVVTAAIVGGTISKITGGKFANGAITAAFAQAFNGEVAAAKHEFEIGLNKAFKRLGIESGGALKINDDGIAVQSDTDIGDLNIKFDSNGEVSMVSKNSIGLTVDVANDVFKEIIQDFSPVQLSLSAGKNNHIDYSLSLGLKSPIVLGWKVTGSINMSEMFKWHPIEQSARTHDGIKNSKYCQYIRCDTLGGN